MNKDLKLEHYGFHKWWYHLSHHFIALPILRKYKFKTDFVKKLKDGPYIIMSNHCTEVDMVILVRAIKPHQYFVCGEHLLRSKVGPTLTRLYNPIGEFKGAAATKTVSEMLRRIKAGANIMIFPEGSRSFNGETLHLPVSTGKLVKLARTGLVTYRIHGGYFVAPRWAYKFRNGKMDGEVVHVYSKQEIAAMTAEEVNNHINEDIYENAYELQRKRMDVYDCDALAEGIENYLIICPKCGGYDTFQSKGDKFWCTKCGVQETYDKYGFLHGDIEYDSVYDWGKWIEKRFDEDMAPKSNDELLFTEDEIELYKVTPDHQQISLNKGSMKVYKDRLELFDMVIPFNDILTMSMLYYGKTLLFTYQGINYGITGEHYHAWKANRLYDLIKKNV